ncbi:Cation efflux system protein CusA [Raoultella terrigena]|uniref:Cation efflux system protein CusA n=1 Tax=Raoultella terrigena TaxID=577 RepID=A0A4U9D8I3_RAOTE|nr:Cation efflux system protein CusA [Raoultella terrigena]
MIKFFVALLVVMVVCFVSMGWRVGVVVAAAVPLTLAIVFVVMEASGKNFDRITLGSLILALGLLVDDAIIAIEMMVVKMEEGYDRIKASAYPGATPPPRCSPVRWSPPSVSCPTVLPSPPPGNIPATCSGLSVSP